MSSWFGRSADWLLIGVMAATAAVLAVYAGTDWKRAAGPAAAALGGAALARGVDVVRERRSSAERLRTKERDSLGETRRLMMALRPIMEHVSNTYLAATVVNSLLNNHADLLGDDDRAALTKWRAADFGPTESAHPAKLAFDRIEPRINDREKELANAS